MLYSYDTDNRLAEVTDIGGNIWKYSYKGNKLVSLYAPNGNTTLKSEYDKSGRVQLISRQGQRFQYSYKESKTVITDDLGREQIVWHTAQGVPFKAKNRVGLTTEIKLNDILKPVELYENGQLIADFIYRENGDIRKFRQFDNSGEIIVDHQYGYSGRRKSVQLTSTDGKFLNATYDQHGNLKLKETENGETSYEYSNYGDIEKVISDQEIITYEHNEYGQPIKILSSGSETKISYNALGKISEIAFPGDNIYRYEYSPLGFRTKTIGTSGGYEKTYNYDPSGNLISAQTSYNGERGKLDISLNEYNQVVQVDHDTTDPTIVEYDDYGNPVKLTLNDRTAFYKYDSESRLTEIKTFDGNTHYYTYRPNEIDIRLALDKRETPVITPVSDPGINKISHTYYTRSTVAEYQGVEFSSDIFAFRLVNSLAYTSGDTIFQATQSWQNTSNLSSDEFTQQHFDMPSNSFFLPPEYYSVNCLFCLLYGTGIAGPNSALLGEIIPYNADPIAECYPTTITDWSLNGDYIGQTNGSGTIGIQFAQSGTNQIDITTYCPCTENPQAYSYKNVSVTKPNCSVDFDLAGSNGFRISETPNMPSITATVTNRVPSNASISWEATISHTAPSGRCGGGPTFSKTITSTGTTFSPNFSSEFYGGELTVKATCSAPNYNSTSKSKSETVTAQEPSVASKAGHIGTLSSPFESADLRRIACHESITFKQFLTNGTPNYGGQGDVGLMQICFQRRNLDLWQWKENVDKGRDILLFAKGDAKSWLDSQAALPGATPYTTNMWRQESIHRYHAGTGGLEDAFWVWDTANGSWKDVKNNAGGTSNYFNLVDAQEATCQ